MRAEYGEFDTLSSIFPQNPFAFARLPVDRKRQAPAMSHRRGMVSPLVSPH